ncbi:hypothetical protein GCM10011504_25550 [Siccirubricoccus deserti]|nr:hypothetical protein GCM10011504_25550 [Siccirubricoccus deserti]
MLPFEPGCGHSRLLRTGELLPYRKHDWPAAPDRGWFFGATPLRSERQSRVVRLNITRAAETSPRRLNPSLAHRPHRPTLAGSGDRGHHCGHHGGAVLEHYIRNPSGPRIIRSASASPAAWA